MIFLLILAGGLLARFLAEKYYEKNWNKTHRIAGFFWTAGGILMVVLGYFRMAVLYFAVLAVIVLVPVGYSYVLYRRESV